MRGASFADFVWCARICICNCVVSSIINFKNIIQILNLKKWSLANSKINANIAKSKCINEKQININKKLKT